MAALGWDQGQVYATASAPGHTQVNSHSEITSLFYGFIQNYRLNNNFIYRYSSTLKINNSSKTCIEINFKNIF